jgi:hypothetical protein
MDNQFKNESTNLQNIHSKLGKNIIMFQRLEGLLKFLISRSHVESFSQSLELNTTKAINKVSGQTMGNLCNQFIDSIFHEKQTSETSSFTFSFHFDVSEEFIDKREANLKKINAERNTLIHQIYNNYDLNCNDSRTELVKKLNDLEKLMYDEFKILKSLVELIISSSKELFEYVSKNLNEDIKK